MKNTSVFQFKTLDQIVLGRSRWKRNSRMSKRVQTSSHLGQVTMLLVLEVFTHSIVNKLGFWKRIRTFIVPVTFFLITRKFLHQKASASVVNLKEEMLQSPANLSFEFPVKLPTRQPAGTNNKIWDKHQKKKNQCWCSKDLALLQKMLVKGEWRKILTIFLARPVVGIAVILLLQLKLCMLSSKYRRC